MNKTEIFKRIKAIAEEQVSQQTTISRADLAYELRDLGVESDTIAVSALVWEAYNHYNKNAAIREGILDNEGRKSVVLNYQIYPLVENENEKALNRFLSNELAGSDQALRQLQTQLGGIVGGGASGKNRVMNIITGTQGVVNVQEEASAIFDQYSQMVHSYEEAKGGVKTVINDFVGLRGYVNETFRTYSLLLTDLFGDSIKTVSPDLFDFDTIQWLDVQGMMKNVQLAYNQISGKCGELMGEISESFSRSLQTAAGSYRAANNRSVGLILAGISMFTHYADAQAQTNELRQQLLTLKDDVRHDATLIKGDLGRLTVIYKMMNDLHIPRAEAFYRYSHQILSKDWDNLTQSLYATPELRTLKEKRDHLLAEYKEAERMAADCQFNIAYYQSHLAECKDLTDSMAPQYRQAKASRPSKPFFLINLLTLGATQKRYNRELAEWYTACEPVITQYEAMNADMKVDKEDLESQQAALQECNKRMKALDRELKKSSKEMLSRIHATPDVKLKVAENLESIIKLLRVAKDIASSRLDKNLTDVVKVDDYRRMELPVEVERNIQTFTDTLRANLQVGTGFAKDSLDIVSDATGSYPSPDGNTSGIAYSEDELQAVAQAQNTAIQGVVNLFESWDRLQARREQSRASAAQYDKELKKLRARFQSTLSEIDDKSAVVHEAIRRIHTGESHETIKDALLALGNADNQSLTPQDWEDFFNGNKTIEI